MGKKRQKSAPAYKPSGVSASAKLTKQKGSQGKLRTGRNASEDGADSSSCKSETKWKPEFEVTPEMFQAARLMRTGVTHVKDLDMSLLAHAED